MLIDFQFSILIQENSGKACVTRKRKKTEISREKFTKLLILVSIKINKFRCQKYFISHLSDSHFDTKMRNAWRGICYL